MTGFFLAVIAAEIAILGAYEARTFRTWITPLNALGVPFLAVATIAWITTGALDFVPVYWPALLLWASGLFIVWVAGFFVTRGLFAVETRVVWQASPVLTVHEVRSVRWCLWLTVALAPLILRGVYLSAQVAGGWSQLGSLEFRVAFSHGLHAHAVVLAEPVTILLIGTWEARRWLQSAAIALLVALLIISGVKGTIIAALLGGAMYRVVSGRLRISLAKLIGGLIGTYVIFSVVYLIAVLVVQPSSAWNPALYGFMVRHYCFYVMAGVLSLSEALRHGIRDVGGDWTTLFSPFINLYRYLFRPEVLVGAGSSLAKGMEIDRLGYAVDAGTNVYTFFGTPFLYLGRLGGALYVAVAGALTYVLLIVAQGRRNEWLLAGYCFVAAQLALGFFELYFWYLTSIEVVAIVLVLALCASRTVQARFGALVKRPVPQGGTIGG